MNCILQKRNYTMRARRPLRVRFIRFRSECRLRGVHRLSSLSRPADTDGRPASFADGPREPGSASVVTTSATGGFGELKTTFLFSLPVRTLFLMTRVRCLLSTAAPTSNGGDNNNNNNNNRLPERLRATYPSAGYRPCNATGAWHRARSITGKTTVNTPPSRLCRRRRPARDGRNPVKREYNNRGNNNVRGTCGVHAPANDSDDLKTKNPPR